MQGNTDMCLHTLPCEARGCTRCTPGSGTGWASGVGILHGAGWGKREPSTVLGGEPRVPRPLLLPESSLDTSVKRVQCSPPEPSPQQLTARGQSDSDELFSLWLRTWKSGAASPPKGSASQPGPVSCSQWRQVEGSAWELGWGEELKCMSFSLQMQNVSHLYEMTSSSVCVCVCVLRYS